jgi:hypothetical protein
MVKKACPREGGGPSSKAAALLARGAYCQYVSTAKGRPACAKRFGEGRERRWRLFSTFPLGDTTKPVLVSELTFRATDRLVLKPTLHIIESRLPYKWANAIQGDEKLVEAISHMLLTSRTPKNKEIYQD